MTGICKFCGESKDLREGGCWDCAEAEAIIDEGLDMRDNGINGEKNRAAIFAGEKLRLLIQKGWTCLSNIQKQ